MKRRAALAAGLVVLATGALALAWAPHAQDTGSREVAPQQNVEAEFARIDERIKGLHVLLTEREKQLEKAFEASTAATLKAAEVTLAAKTDLERLDERVQNLEKSESALSGRAGGVGSAQNWLFQVGPILISLVALAALLWERRRGSVEKGSRSS